MAAGIHGLDQVHRVFTAVLELSFPAARLPERRHLDHFRNLEPQHAVNAVAGSAVDGGAPDLPPSASHRLRFDSPRGAYSELAERSQLPTRPSPCEPDW